MTNYYEILGIEKNASEEEIKEAWKTKIKEHHPDIGGNEEIAKQINIAYETLSDAQKRAIYDNPRSNIPFNPFSGAGGFNINLNDLFARMAAGGGHSFRFSSQMQLEQEIDITLLDAILENEIDIPIHQIQKTIKFKIPPNLKGGDTVGIRINNGNNIIIIHLKINVVIPNISSEKKEKLKELLS